MWQFLAWIKKAIGGGIIAGAGAAIEAGRQALTDGQITLSEWEVIVGTFFVVGAVAGAAVFQLRNGPKPSSAPAPESNPKAA